MVGYSGSLAVTDLVKWVPPWFKDYDIVASGYVNTYQAKNGEENVNESVTRRIQFQ
jgi:hypothetical protein